MADLLTTRREVWGYVRALVEVDFSKPLLKTINIFLSSGKIIKQVMEYERLPLFCEECR